jgi:hypothetical protein
MHSAPFSVADAARVKGHFLNGGAVWIVLIGINPLLIGWKPGADGSIDKGLDAGCRGSPFVWCENPAIRIM